MRRVASPPSSTMMSRGSEPQSSILSVHHQYSSRVSPFQANTAAESRATAAAACHQAIAGDAAFVIAFIADMGEAFEPPAPYMYPRLFWQAGALGQRLYLAATARGLGVSGIGCFFDDAVHAFVGLSDQRFQALYLVAVGAALPDERLLAEDPFVGLRGEGVSFTV